MENAQKVTAYCIGGPKHGEKITVIGRFFVAAWPDTEFSLRFPQGLTIKPPEIYDYMLFDYQFGHEKFSFFMAHSDVDAVEKFLSKKMCANLAPDYWCNFFQHYCHYRCFSLDHTYPCFARKLTCGVDGCGHTIGGE